MVCVVTTLQSVVGKIEEDDKTKEKKESRLYPNRVYSLQRSYHRNSGDDCAGER